MKGMSRIISTLALLLTSLSVVPPADAVLKARGPVSQAHGYPSWYQDTNNLALSLCLDQNGFCILAPPVDNPLVPIAADRTLINAGNFSVEAFYFLAETTVVDPAGTVDLFYRAALESGFANAVVDGGQAVFTRARIRADVTVPGTYTVTHPYGVETFVIDTILPGALEINFTADNPGLIAGAFDAALANDPAFPTVTWGPFLTNPTTPFVTDPVTGNRYIGNAVTPVLVTGSPNNTNLVQIVGPTGTFSTNAFILMGKIIGMDVQPATNVNLGATNIITPAAVPKTVTVTNTTGDAITFPADLNAVAVKAGADAADFVIAPPTQPAAPAPPIVDCTNATVAVAGVCGFDVTFIPAKVAKAARAATLLLAPTVVAPAIAPPSVTLNLSGTGEVLVTATAVGHGIVTPNTIAVGAGTTVDLTVTPENKKFKIKEVADGVTLLGTPAGTPPFTLNTGAANHAVTATFMPSGDLDEDGTLGVADAQKALRIVAGVQAADANDPDNTAVKVAPLVGGVPAPDAARTATNIGDVLVILRRVIGLENW
ncbi:MAG: hypothetical protein FD174_353 [Geobacteraceae bacterium]|nr:MAG: hypothetical protein FD174_353 [Geobacteraceae bacterium]